MEKENIPAKATSEISDPEDPIENSENLTEFIPWQDRDERIIQDENESY
jgi:hypothetical protein